MNLAKTLTPADQQQQSRPPIPPLIIRKGNNGNGVPDYSHHIQNKSLTKTDIFVVSGKNVENVDKLKQPVDSADEEGGALAGTSDDSEFKASRIRKRRYSTARIQPTRIKKVMQSDEDIGRMVASVPVAIGSAMEIFADRLLQGAAEALQHSSTKTLSPMHIKYAVSQIKHFAFLEPILRDIQMPRPGTGGIIITHGSVDNGNGMK